MTNRWTEKEEKLLRNYYVNLNLEKLLELFPNKDMKQIVTKAEMLGLHF